ncbi:hypothetical protein QE109_12710 [Fusibacter bizertensis]|uniref:Uncharacterized protein n=1 Tax=Fusibacter bizertensis TaxID=1488331 RepID=A0ABT6NF17_9FIRM|nr:hypothetical protein [Fusibacter bizertensis]MDH8679014.1 hypothetical protein [Fusibacter bizertensis]
MEIITDYIVELDSLELRNLDNMSKEWLFLLHLNNISTYQDLSIEFGNFLLEKMTIKAKELDMIVRLPNLELIYNWISEACHKN